MINKQIESYQNLLYFLERNYYGYTPTQKRVANFLLSHTSEASYLTTDELSLKVNTTPSSIVRFAKRIGYNGYPELQRDLGKLVINRINNLSPYEKAKKFTIPKYETIINSSILTDIDNLKVLLTSNIESKINSFVDILLNSQKTYVIGNRSSFSSAYILWYYLKKTIDKIYLLNNYNGSIFDYLREFDDKSTLIAISFPNYAKLTLDFCCMAKNTEIQIISITDSKKSPLCELSSLCIFVPSKTVGYHTSRVAVGALINAIISKVFVRKRDITISNLGKESKINKQFLNEYKL